jgi:HEAT repeat protein
MVGALIAALLVLMGCGKGGQARDFNELIPRLMKPVKTFNNPNDAAANLFNVTSADERRDAVAYLAKKKYGFEPAYMRAYQILTTDPHPMVRSQAIRALGASKKQEAVPYLIDGAGKKTGLLDADAGVRKDAAQGLRQTYNDTAVPLLTKVLATDPEDQVRTAAARALRNTHSPAGLDALIKALDDKNAAVVYWASDSLKIATGNKFQYDRAAWVEWFKQTYPGYKPAG